MRFISLVPHAQVKHNPREESAFRDTQKEPRGEESRKVLDDAHEGADDTPCEGDGRKPEPRRRAFENDVAWDLE